MRKEEFKAKMARIHFSQKNEWNGKPLHEAIVSICMDLGIAGATVYRGVEGVGVGGRIYQASLWPGSNDPPIMISIIDTEEQIARLLPHLEEMISEGIVAISDVDVIRYSNVVPSSSQ